MPLGQAFAWADRIWEIALQKFGRESVSLSYACQASSITSECSGMSSESQAIKQIKASAGRHQVPCHLTVVSACDVGPWSQQYLMRTGIPHVQVDIRDCLSHSGFEVGAAWEQNVAAIWSNPLCTHVRCLRCSGACSRPWMWQDDICVVGLPCQDLSTIGLQAGLQGPTMEVWLTFARKHRKKRTKVILIAPQPDLSFIT